MNCDNTNVSISSLIARRDDLYTKIAAVNKYLKHNCNERNVAYIDNDNINKCEHLNDSGLHLNMTGTNLLYYNYLCYISNLGMTEGCLRG